MPQKLYIASIEPRSGKSLVALGVMEMLSRRIRNLGFFRPVIPDVAEDNNIQLISRRYHLTLPHDALFAYRRSEAQKFYAAGRHEVLLATMVNKFRGLEQQCKFVLCEGTDYIGASSAFEFDINADAASNFGCPVLAVVNGRDKTPPEILDAIRTARESFREKGCAVLAVIANRVVGNTMESLAALVADERKAGNPVYLIPESPRLGKPTVGEVANGLNARVLRGGKNELNREIHDFKVAAMTLPHVLDYIEEGTLLIAPGDRSDVILGALAASLSDRFPKISGLLLTGGLAIEPQVLRLIEGFRGVMPVPIISVETDTYTTAMNAGAIRPALTLENTRKIAAALGLFENHVDAEELEKRIEVVRSVRRTPLMFEYDLIERAKKNRQRIVLPEGGEERILRAAEILIRRGVVDLVLLGNPREISQRISFLGLHLNRIDMIDPLSSELTERFAHIYHELRRHKGISLERARDTVSDVNYFGTLMVHEGLADGMVSGAVHTTGETLRPAFEIIRTQPGVSIVSSVFLMCLPDKVLVYGDCAVNPNPDSEQLADIAASSAETARMFGIEPRIAMLSYSTGASGKGQDVDLVREATRIVQKRRPDLKVEGPIQYDAAVDASVARTKIPGSEVAGQASVFIFPDLNTGNNTYKAVQRSAHAVAIGPVLQGLKKPVNDLSRGCTVTDIVNTVAITAVQAQSG
jgi:phosphate acetyltransferase